MYFSLFLRAFRNDSIYQKRTADYQYILLLWYVDFGNYKMFNARCPISYSTGMRCKPEKKHVLSKGNQGYKTIQKQQPKDQTNTWWDCWSKKLLTALGENVHWRVYGGYSAIPLILQPVLYKYARLYIIYTLVCTLYLTEYACFSL